MYCPECGFHQSEAHKYCGRCGALLIVENQGTGEITGPFAISDHAAETGEWQGPSIEGPTLAVRAGGPPGAMFSLDRDTVTIGREPTADVFLDDVTVSRNHAVITRLPTRRRAARPGQPQRDLRQPPPHRGRGGPRGRRRAPDRQVPPDVPGRVTEPTLLPDERGPEEGSMTIGAVCDLLRAEHPTISISKIRYLEDQKLITPKRTAGGYRLYSPLEVERLRTILRLQRDEFLPLRVIRQELESSTTGAFSVANQAKQLKRAQLAEPAPTRRYTAQEILATTGAPATLLKALEEYGLVGGQPRRRRPGLRRDRPRGGPDGAGAVVATASSRGTCASSGSPPSARRGCWSSC